MKLFALILTVVFILACLMFYGLFGMYEEEVAACQTIGAERKIIGRGHFCEMPDGTLKAIPRQMEQEQ